MQLPRLKANYIHPHFKQFVSERLVMDSVLSPDYDLT